MLITKGKTNVHVNVRIVDSTDGTPETGVTADTSGLLLWYRRDVGALVTQTAATLATLTTAHTDKGIKHIGNGWYRTDIEDAAFATGVDGVQIGGAVTGMVVHAPYVQLVDVDLFDGVRGGMTSLPNAAYDDAGGIGNDISNVASVVSAISAAVAAVKVDTGNISLSVSAMSTVLDKVSAETGRLSLSVSSIAVTVGNISGSVSSIKTVVDKVSVETGKLSLSVSAISTLLATVETDSSNLVSAVAVVNTQIGTAGDGLTALVDLVWDEVLTGATHNVTDSSGRRLRQVDAAFEVHDGTAQTSTTSTSITLDTGASASDDIYRGDRIIIVEGTGAQEHNIITAYNGTTKVATVAEPWVISPDNTSVFEIVPASVDVEAWQHNPATASPSGLPDVNTLEINDAGLVGDGNATPWDGA